MLRNTHKNINIKLFFLGKLDVPPSPGHFGAIFPFDPSLL